MNNMKRLLGILALIFVFASSAYATDVTVGASTIPNFNPSNAGSDRTLTVTVNNGSNIVSCSACMPSNTVGLSGFRVNINGSQYVVQSVSTQSLFVLTTLYSGAGGSTSMTLYKYVLFRIYADRAFQPKNKTYIVQPGVPGSSSWYKQVGASIISDGATSSLYLSEMILDATTDAVSPTNQAKYTAAFYRTDNSLVQYYNCFEQFALPATTPTTWTAICTYNSPTAIVPPNRDSYTKSEIDNRFASCSSGQLYYFASSGNVVSCLTLGTNLSITSGVLNATGGGGGGGSNIRQAYNAKVDYSAVGNGVANDTTPLQNCINAAQAGGFECYLPGGTYLVTGLTITGSTMLVGDGVGKTIIYSTTNADILNVSASAFRGATIQDMTIRGLITAGSSQNALKIDDGSYVFGVQVRNVTIENAGNYGLYVGNVYSSQFENMFITNCVNYPLLYAAPAMPSNTFVNIYIGDVRATAPTGFRIKQGDFNCISCNGINNVVASSRIAAVGRKNGVDGDVVNSGAVFDCTSCNFESWVSNGILSYSSSLINVRGRSRFAVDASGVGTGKPIQFDLAGDGSDFYAQQIARGVIEDSVSIDQALANYANSQAVHANGFAPIETQGVGPSIANSVPLSTYWDSSTSLIARLSRKDGQAPVVSITASATYTNPGVRYIEANCPTACTITLPWPGWYQVGQSVMIKDISGAAAANNITITAGSGGTVNGSTYAIATNGGSVILMPNNTTLDWRVVSIGITSGPVTGSGTAPRLATWSAATTLSSTSGLEYDSGNSAVKSPGRFWGANNTSGSPTFSFTNDNGTGMYLAGATTDLGFALNGSAIFTLNSTASTLLSTLNPDVSNTRDLGAASTRWRSGYFQTSAILGAGSTTSGVLTFNNSTNANTFTLQPGVTGANLTYTLPTAYSTGTQCLADNGSGTLSWTACSGGSSSPGGSNTQVQFNDSGNFNGDSGLTYNKTTNVLSTDHAIITQSDTTIVPLIVKAVAASTAELLQIKDSAGNVRGGYATSGAGFYRGFSSAPTAALANDGKLFYDITGGVTNQQLVLSKNTGQYNPIVVANQASYTANKIPLWSSTSWELENSMMTQGSGAVSLTIAPTASSSGSPTIFTLTGPAHTALAADTEATDVNLNLNRNVQFTAGGGAFSLQRAMRFQSPTYRATGAETISNATLLYLDTPKAGTNMTLTASYALGIAPSAVGHHGLYFDFQTSATGNFIEFNSSGSSFGKIVSRTDRANYVFGGHTTSTADTDGFVYIPSVAGVPAGTPTAYTGTVPLTVDSTNSRLYAYFAGAWTNLTGSGGGTPGGSNTQLQYNNAGAFGGISGATSNGTNVTFGSGNLIATTPTITTSLVTGSASFDLLNTTATTINFGGAASTMNIGGSAAAIKLGGGAVAAELRFMEPSGGGTDYLALKAQAMAAPLTFTFPATDSTGTQCLASNGSGTLSWTACSGGAGSPGGSDTQVQFNDSSAFGGDADFTWNKTTNLLTLTSGGIVLATGGALKTSTTGADTLLIQAYNTGGASYTTFLTLTAGASPTMSVDQSLSWADGVKQTFNPNGTNAGINIGSQAGDPSSPTNGDMWYDSSGHLYRIRVNGATATLATIATSQIFTNKTLSTGISVSQPLTWSSGIRQTFSPDATTPGINVGSFAGDPSTPSNGDIWYNSTSNKFRCYENGASANCIGSGGGTPAGSNKQLQFNNSSSFGGAAGFEYQSGASPNVLITAQNLAYVALKVDTAASPTASAQEWYINGSLKTAIGPDGYLYVGKGYQSATATSGTISGTEGTGLNKVGGYLRLQGAAGTGTGAGGSITFYTAAAGGAGSSLNPYVLMGEIDQLGNVFLGDSTALRGTSATNGFLYMNATNGTPAGTPATVLTGIVPTSIDATNYRLYAYIGGAWRNLSGAAAGLTIGTTAITSGTAGRILYETSGNVVGEIAGSSVDANGAVQFAATARTSGVASYYRINTPADTGQTASTESVGAYFGGNGSGATVTRKWANGNITTQRENVFVAPTYDFVSGSNTITTAATVAITGAPSAGSFGTITNAAALLIQNGAILASGASNAYSFSASTNSAMFYSAGGGDIRFTIQGYNGPQLHPTKGIIITGDNNSQYAWRNGSTFADPDTGVARFGAAIVRVTDGGTGSGQLVVGSTSVSIGAQAHIVSGSASRVALRVDSAATPSVDIVQFTNNGTNRWALNSSSTATTATVSDVNGGTQVRGTLTESITLSTSGTTTDSTIDLPANSIILSVTGRITTTITTATDWKLGDATIADRFSDANATLTSGTTTVGINQWKADRTTAGQGPYQASTAKVRITTTGTPGAGVIRITVHYISITPATN